jgi:uncharacterized protein YegP (UPF0339 family)
MATATRKARTASRAERGHVEQSGPSEFRVVENNAGDFQWVLVSASEAVLARSGAFTSAHDAHSAAASVRAGASSAGLEQGSADAGPVAAA